MKDVATADYLMKGSGVDWADCLAKSGIQIGIGSTDYGDTDYLYAGKAFYINGAPSNNWKLVQTFLRFNTSGIADSHEIVSATIRLYIAEAPDTDFTMYMGLLDATYGTLTHADWGAAATTNTTVESSSRTTDSNGNAYIDIALTGAFLAAVTTSATTIDLIFKGNDESAEPTDKEWLKFYNPGYATTSLRPYLYVKTRSGKEQIFEALLTQLGTIAETSGYLTTPATVSRKYRLVNELSAMDFPVYFPIPGDEHLGTGTLGVDRWMWTIFVVAGVYVTDDDEKFHELDGMVEDVKDLIHSDPELGLASIVINSRVMQVETGELFIIDDHRGVSLIHIEIEYIKSMYET